MSNHITFAGVVVATPKLFKVDFQDLDSEKSLRNTKGVLHRDRIRGSVRKISFEWGLLSLSEASPILKAISPVGIDVFYPDPMDGKWETRHLYSGNRTIEAICDLDSGMWNGLAFDLVEP